MRQRSSQSIELNYPKIILSLVIVFLIAIMGYSMYLYSNIRSNEDQGFDQSIQRVSEEIDANQIEQVTRFHGNIYYHVIHHKDDQQVTYYFVDQTDKTRPILSYATGTLHPLDTIIKSFKSDRPDHEITSVNVGMREKTPIVEIISMTSTNAIRYDYYNLSDRTYESGLTLNNVN